MTDTSTEDSVSVTIALYPEDGETKALRQIAYGMTPFVLLEVEPEEEGDGLVFKVVGSLIDSNEELIEVIETFLSLAKDALEQHAAAEGVEVPEGTPVFADERGPEGYEPGDLVDVIHD